MKYKISNTASVAELENFSHLPFKYPKLHKKREVINSEEENIVPIITANQNSVIDFGIWGLLPDNFDENWEDFHRITNASTMVPKFKKSDKVYKNLHNLERCVILVTGFFTTLLHNGKTYPYYVYNKTLEPFYLAGYCNRLDDGFITFCAVLHKVQDNLKEIQNLSTHILKTLNSKEKDLWLANSTPNKVLKKLVKSPASVDLTYHTIAKELFKLGVNYSSMLEPVQYKELL